MLNTSFLEASKSLIMVATNVGSDVMQKITGAQDPNMGTLSDTVEKTGNGFIYIAITIIAVLAVLALIIAAGKVMVGSAVQKSEGKNSLFWVIIAAVIAFGAIGIITLAAAMSGTFFN